MNVKVCESVCGCKCVWVWVEEDAVDVVRRSEWSKGRKEKSKEQREGTTLYACINTKKLKTNAHICPDSSCLALSLPLLLSLLLCSVQLPFTRVSIWAASRVKVRQSEWLFARVLFYFFLPRQPLFYFWPVSDTGEVISGAWVGRIDLLPFWLIVNPKGEKDGTILFFLPPSFLPSRWIQVTSILS